MFFPSALAFGGSRRPMPKLLRMAGYVHGQIIFTPILPVSILKFVDTVTGVINAVALLEQVDFAVECEPKRTALYRDILPGTRIVGKECTGVYTRGQRCPHELELHIG